jgi:hypothetical protein
MDSLLSDEQREIIGISFLRHMLGVSEDSIKNFVEDKPVLHKDICAKMSGMKLPEAEAAKYDEKSFWDELRPVLGPLYETATTRFMTYAAKQGPYMLMISATPINDRKSVTARLLYMKEVYDDRL